ncbi:MAG: DEAD/DEAH box helicase [Acidimicrobiales bacterium]
MLADRVAGLVAARPGLTAEELAARLGPDGQRRGAVELALYGSHGRFACDRSEPPRWWLAVPAVRADRASGVVGRRLEVGTDLWRNRSCSADHRRPTHVEASAPGPGVSPPSLWAWQADALGAWAAAGRRGVVEAVTGTGKTLVGVAAAAGTLAGREPVLVLVPTVELAHQWVAELSRQLGPGARIGRLGAGATDTLATHDALVAVVNSARDFDVRPIRPGGLLVADECHRYGSGVNRLALDPRFPARLGLSATYAREDDGHLRWLRPYFGATCFRMGYRRAVAEGVTARFRVGFVGVAFTAPEQDRYDDLSERMTRLRAALVDRYGLPAEPFEDFLRAVMALAERAGGDEDGTASGLARRYRLVMLERRRLLADTPVKAEALTRLAPAVAAADRAMVFTQSIRASEEAAGVLSACGLRAGVVHSTLPGSERGSVLARFGAGQLDVICAPRVLDEGVDVPAADLAVILGASRSRRQMVQRMGRVLRRKADGRAARFAVVFVEGTVEDPARGAHQTFVEEITSVADGVRRWGAEEAATDAAAVCAYLSPGQRGSARV